MRHALNGYVLALKLAEQVLVPGHRSGRGLVPGHHSVQVLVRLHNTLDKQSKLKGKVIGAMIYPLAITLVAIGVVVFLLTFIIPKFVKIFENHGAELPVLTSYVVGASNLLLTKWGKVQVTR